MDKVVEKKVTKTVNEDGSVNKVSEKKVTKGDNNDDKQAAEDLQAAMDALNAGEDTLMYDDTPDVPLVTSDEEMHDRETSIGTKSVQSGGYDTREGIIEEESESIGGKITKIDENHCRYEGSLGNFDYDTKDWAIQIKTITSKDGLYKTDIPVLRYIGDATAGNDVEIPEGVKNLDYTFEGNKKLETVPYIPDSVESAHAAFMNCTSITRASKDAKIGEHQGGFDLAGWAAGGAGAGAVAGGAAGGVIGHFAGAAAGGVAGAVAGAGVASAPAAVAGAAGGGTAGTGVGAAIGGGIGAVVGGIGGAVKGTFEYFDKDGKGGTWTMPANLKDASNMFDGCTSLTEGFEAAPDSLINARGMYNGAKDLGIDKYATAHGSVSVTDMSDSSLSKEASEDMYNDTNVDVINAAKDNYSKDWNEEEGKMEKKELTDAEKKEVEDLSQTLKAEDIKNGVVETDMSAATGGIAHTGKVRTPYGTRSTESLNAENKDPEKSGGFLDGLGGVAGLVDRGLVSFGEFKLLKMFTGNTLLSAGIVLGGQMLGVLPKSMKPILSTVAGFVGKDNPIGAALNGLVDKLPDTETKASAKEKLSESASGLVSSSGSRLESSIKDPMMLAASGKLSGDQIVKSMSDNASRMMKDGVFYDIGSDMVNNKDIGNMKRTALLTGAALEEHAVMLAGKSGKLSDEQKKELSENVMNVMSGLESYHKAGRKELTLTYGSDASKGSSAETGLNNTMGVTLEPIYQSVKEMDDKYHFLSDDDKKKLNKFDFKVFAPTYEDYCNGKSFPTSDIGDQLSDQALLDDGYTADDMMYANAGLDEESDVKESDKKDSDTKTSDSKEDTEESKDDSKNKSEKKNKLTRKQRLALAGVSEDTPEQASDDLQMD